MMSVFKVQRCVKCILQKGVVGSQVRRRCFKKFTAAFASSDTIEKRAIQDASKFLSSILGEYGNGSIYTGTGQYHELKDQDRILMLNFGENFLTDTDITLFDTTALLDCCLKHTDVDLLIENVKLRSRLPVYSGEVDFINTSSWQYGFTLKPFSIFSGDERLCFIRGASVYTSIAGKSEVIPVKDIEYVGLWVSEEPYNERRLLLGMKNKRNKTLICVDKNNEHCDLGTLTVDTEWLMKTAALLCVNLTKQGNANVHLKVSPALQPTNNQWVAMRQKVWIEMIQKNTWDNNDV